MTADNPRELRPPRRSAGVDVGWAVSELFEAAWIASGRPGAIDVLRELPGVRWDTAWRERSHGRLFGQRVPFLGRRALLRNKRTVGRPIDLADVEELLRMGLTRRDRRPKQ